MCLRWKGLSFWHIWEKQLDFFVASSCIKTKTEKPEYGNIHVISFYAPLDKKTCYRIRISKGERFITKDKLSWEKGIRM